jgi:hypothetical protein
MATITVNDSVPAAHAFAPVTTDGASAKFANRASGTTPAGWELMGIEVRQPPAQNGATKVVMTFYDPTEVTVGGVTSLDRFDSAKLEFNYSQKSLSVERLDLLAIVSNALANATVKSVHQNLEPIY